MVSVLRGGKAVGKARNFCLGSEFQLGSRNSDIQLLRQLDKLRLRRARSLDFKFFVLRIRFFFFFNVDLLSRKRISGQRFAYIVRGFRSLV